MTGTSLRGPLAEPVLAPREPEFAPWGASRRLRLLILGNTVLAAAYFSWWLSSGHVGTPALFILLACAEGFTLVQLAGVWWALWHTKVVPPPPLTTPFSIDVLIPTRGEPLGLLERTIAAAVDMRLPHLTYVLDDAARPEVEALADRLGARYVPREERKGDKAGNLNHALAMTSGDLIAIFDADHVPHRDFLLRLAGYFEDDTVAFVQTPQFYGNARAQQVARGAYQQQAIFYGPLCRGKNGLGAVFCCGTNVLFRRSALDDVGGFDERSIVEDFVTSMRIHRLGWRSVYYPYVLAEGVGPSNVASYFRQQFRWARGSVGALFSGEPFKPGFALSQRIQYILATSFYMIGLVTAVYVLLPILYLLGGWSAFSTQSGDFLFFYGPYFLLGLVTIRMGLGGQLRLEHLGYTFGSFPVYALASIAAMLHRPARFGVTDKSGGQRTSVPTLALISVGAFVVTVLAILAGAFLRPFGARTLTNMSWGVINLLLLSGIAGAVGRELLPMANRLRGRGAARAPARIEAIAGGAIDMESGNGHGNVTVLEPLLLPEHALPRRGFDRFARVREAVRGPSRRSFRPIIAVTVLTVLGLALRLALIDVQSLRLDEASSLRQVQRYGLRDLIAYLYGANVHVPLYHVLLKLWIGIAGTTEWAIRLPSVVFGTASIPLLFVIGRRLVGRRAAVVAAAIGAASPFWVWHSDEARMYPLLIFTVLASMALLFRAVEEGRAWRWAAYAAVTGISFYTHYFALLMPPVHLAYLLINRVGWRKVLAWAASGGTAVLMFAPWIVLLYAERIQGGSGLTTLTNGIRTSSVEYTSFGLLYGILIFCAILVTGYHGVGGLAAVSSLVVGMWPLLAVAAALNRRFLGWLRTRAAMFLLAWLVLTIGTALALSYYRPGLWLQRYLIVATPPMFFILALGISRVLRRQLIALTLVFVSFGAVAIAQNFEAANPAREDFRGAAATVERDFRPGDVVLVLPGWVAGPFEHYYDGEVVRVLSAGTATQVIRERIPDLARAHAGGSLWIVIHDLYSGTFPHDVFWAIPRYLDATYPRTAVHRLGLVEVRRYSLPPG